MCIDKPSPLHAISLVSSYQQEAIICEKKVVKKKGYESNLRYNLEREQQGNTVQYRKAEWLQSDVIK